VDYEHLPKGGSLLGPHVIFTPPILDWGQAKRARAKAALKQSQHKLAAKETEVLADVREARDRLLAARSTALFYRDSLLPKARRSVELSQAQFNIKKLGAYDLLKVRQDELAAQKDATEALRDYWIARAKLGYAVGGVPVENPGAAPVWNEVK
jgi:outer membrane protein TolC